LKLAICIPCYGDPKAKFMQSLATMLIHTMGADLRDEKGDKIKLQIEVFIVSSSMLTEGRHKLVAEALVWEADYMLWLDADHVFPHDAFCRLWGAITPAAAHRPRRLRLTMTVKAPRSSFTPRWSLPSRMWSNPAPISGSGSASST
jgi:hypothetical protein